MDQHKPLYLGFDLSTQQLKGLAVTSDLRVVHSTVFDFDKDAPGFNVTKGVLTNEEEKEVFAPVAMWLQALDSVLEGLRKTGLDFTRVRGISGAGQQHGSVYWSTTGWIALQNLDSARSLQEQLHDAFAYPSSPNWQDASTQDQCDRFDEHLGSEVELALNTGSKAHHRFTGPQIMRFRTKHPEEYSNTIRISLVSSFLASLFLGDIAPFDISDVCGMNLWDVKKGMWNETLLALTAGSEDTADLRSKLGDVPEDGGADLGKIAPYFVHRYGFNSGCKITPFTGDNPSTILALPLRPLDAIVSLGTSTTFLMSTPHYKPDPAVHFFNHPTTAGLYMFMLCYKNGGLAREQVRDSLPPSVEGLQDTGSDVWGNFNHLAVTSPPLGQVNPQDPQKQALYFPRPEIVPNVQAGLYRYTFDPNKAELSSNAASWSFPTDDPRAIIESQLLSLRLRSRNIVAPIASGGSEAASDHLPAQPRRIYLVGGGSLNPAIAQLAAEILGGAEGIYKLDVGGNACALGSAYKAVWACERKPGETFEELIGKRWDEASFIGKVAEGYQPGIFELYARGVEGLDKIEADVLEKQRSKPRGAGLNEGGWVDSDISSRQAH